MSETNVARAQVTRHIAAPAEQVFDAWLDPRLARRWFAPGLGEMTRADIDARVGGRFHLDQRRGDGIAQHTGEYLELDRPRRIVFTWQTPPLHETSRVIITIEPDGEGSDVTVTHEMSAEWESFVDRGAAAWRTMVDALAAALHGEHH